LAKQKGDLTDKNEIPLSAVICQQAHSGDIKAVTKMLSIIQ
jgi:hypothetical protein